MSALLDRPLSYELGDIVPSLGSGSTGTPPVRGPEASRPCPTMQDHPFTRTVKASPSMIRFVR